MLKYEFVKELQEYVAKKCYVLLVLLLQREHRRGRNTSRDKIAYLYSSLNSTCIIKSRRVTWERRVSRMEAIRKAGKMLAGKRERKTFWASKT
jgi:hypothetical protein